MILHLGTSSCLEAHGKFMRPATAATGERKKRSREQKFLFLRRKLRFANQRRHRRLFMTPIGWSLPFSIVGQFSENFAPLVFQKTFNQSSFEDIKCLTSRTWVLFLSTPEESTSKMNEKVIVLESNHAFFLLLLFALSLSCCRHLQTSELWPIYLVIPFIPLDCMVSTHLQ